MTMAPQALPRVLLVEQQFVMRRTIVSVARDLGVADVQDASTVDRGRALLAGGAYQGLLLNLDDASGAIELLAELRGGKFVSRPDVPVIVMASELRPADEQRLKTLKVSQLLRKPFKIGVLLNAVARDGHMNARPAEG